MRCSGIASRTRFLLVVCGACRYLTTEQLSAFVIIAMLVDSSKTFRALPKATNRSISGLAAIRAGRLRGKSPGRKEEVVRCRVRKDNMKERKSVRRQAGEENKEGTNWVVWEKERRRRERKWKESGQRGGVCVRGRDARAGARRLASNATRERASRGGVAGTERTQEAVGKSPAPA
jgi:hypothetical protein